MTFKARTTAAAMADAFAAIVRRELGPHLVEITDRNKTPDYRNTGSCATHDFCDANELMAEAFEEIEGREPDPSNYADAATWSQAWSIAAAHDFRNGADQ